MYSKRYDLDITNTAVFHTEGENTETFRIL